MCGCAVQVYDLRTPRMLLDEWMTECKQDGYLITRTHRINGNCSYVMMTKEGKPKTQQIYMMRMLATSCQSFKTDAMPGLDSVCLKSL